MGSFLHPTSPNAHQGKWIREAKVRLKDEHGKGDEGSLTKRTVQWAGGWNAGGVSR